MILEHAEDAPLVILANFASAAVVDLAEGEVVRKWSTQAPREIWLARPGDVLVTPVPLSDAFLHYACRLLGVPKDAIDVVVVPDIPGVPMGEAVGRHNRTGLLRALASRGPGTRLLPTIVDSPSVVLAAELGIPLFLYGLGDGGPDPSGPDPCGAGGVGADALQAVSRLNTKAGFRAVAEALGMRMPRGRVCEGHDLPCTARELLDIHERVVIKPDRSAGGHGLRFVSRDDPTVVREPERSGWWIVEEYVRHTREISIQCVVETAGPRTLFSGEMQTWQGSFTGYRSPLRAVPDTALKELELWGMGLGQHLAEHGYSGPYDIDAVLTGDGTLYVTESNVRRTATTTPQAMVTRLGETTERPFPAWLLGKRASAMDHTFDEAVELLDTAGLAYGPARGEGVVLYADRPAEGADWRYAIIGADQERLTELETELSGVLRLIDPSCPDLIDPP